MFKAIESCWGDAQGLCQREKGPLTKPLGRGHTKAGHPGAHQAPFLTWPSGGQLKSWGSSFVPNLKSKYSGARPAECGTLKPDS